MASTTAPKVHDEDHPDFDNEGPWPRRLLHIPTMTSHKWQPGNKYGHHMSPSYHTVSYTWGRWRLKDEPRQKPDVEALFIKGVPWPIPRVDPDHFTVVEFESVIRQAVKVPPPLFSKNLKKRRWWSRWLRKYGKTDDDEGACQFLWLDIACIDQRYTLEAKLEVGRQARIFRKAKHVYIWLNHTPRDTLSRIALDLKKSSAATWDLDSFGSLSDAQGFIEWCGQALDRVRELVHDPWFSSLWTLQEAFLSPDALLLAKGGQVVEEEEGYTLRLNYITARIHTIQNAAEQDGSEQNSSQELQNTPMLSLIESSGLAALWQQNPMAALTISRFRKAEFELDRVYGIMQIFGDSYKVGEAAGPDSPRTVSVHQYTLLELQDELGALLLQQNPVLSQMHVHLEPPEFGKGWRVGTVSAIPYFASHPENYASETGDMTNTRVGDNVAVCKLSTTRAEDGLLWGYLSGRACPFDTLQKAWRRQFYSASNKRFDWSRRAPLQIAFDQVPGLPKGLSYQGSKKTDEAQHEFANQLSLHFSATQLMVFLLGQEVFGDWAMEGEQEALSDRFVGMILLEQTHRGMQYWQRLGICRWTSYRIKSAVPDDPDRDILLGYEGQWRPLEGFFG